MARTVQQYFLDWCCEGCFFFWVQTSRPKILRSCLDLWWFVNKRGQSRVPVPGEVVDQVSRSRISEIPVWYLVGPLKSADKEFLRTERHVHF
jgi:hypothetical protein